MKRVAIVENSKDLGSFFARYLKEGEYQLFPVWKDPVFPDAQNFHAFIITGDYNNLSDGLLPLHEQEIEFLRSVGDKKVFGSCFGHQLLGVLNGGTLGRRTERFFGWNRMNIVAEHPVFKGLKNPFFLSLNGDELVEKPSGAEVLATNEDCRYMVLQYGETIISCQSHPEIRKQEGLASIQENRASLLDRCPDLGDIVNRTMDLADDRASDNFLSNIMVWLRS